MAEERRHTDEEFAAILRSAAEAQLRGRGRLPAKRDGFSLAELVEIAEQAGLDPELVAAAARRLPAQHDSVGARIFGGPSRVRLEFTLGHAIRAAEHAHILEEIRRTENSQGETESTGDALEWKTVGDPHQVALNLTPSGDRTRVMILVNRDALGGMTFGASAITALITASITEAFLGMGGITETVLVGGAAVAGAFTTARIIWQTTTSGLRRRLARRPGGNGGTHSGGGGGR